MLRPARLLKRITAFNNPAFAKISQRSRITFAAANQRARSHCFADHLFLPGVTFAKMEARYYGSPHCFRGKGGGETRQTKRSNLRFEFFPFYIYIYIYSSKKLVEISSGTCRRRHFRRVSWAVHYQIYPFEAKGLAQTTLRFALPLRRTIAFLTASSPRGITRNPV